ncbi:DUF222 domain-containing protein [Microbispora sp. NEAU-D428]|nr:DUF222 domain-containing protein [Microbispora sitophila]
MGSLRESAQELALAPLPDDVDICLAEAEELMVARDRITCALAERVGRVHRAGQAKRHGHASTRSWLRSAGGMSVAGAGRLLTVAVELARLPRVRAAFAEGSLAAGVVEAICTATARLNDEQAGVAEPILLELAGKAGAAEVAKAGRYLRAVLDPDGEERDEQADYGRRFLRVRPARGGGLEGEFYLPREAAARLRALLDAYAKPRAEGDDRPPSVRNADAFIALLEQEIATELLVLVNAESLPTDPEPEHPGHAADPGTAEAEAGAEVGVTAGAGAESADRATTAPRDEESHDPGVGGRGSREERTRERQASECGPRDAASTAAAEDDDTAQATGGDCDRGAVQAGSMHARRASAWPVHGGSAHAGTAPPHTAPPHRAPPTAAPPTPAQQNPPPEDSPGHHTHAGHRPAGDCRHAQATPGGHGHRQQGHGEGGRGCGRNARCSSATPGTPRPEPETPPGRPPGRPPGTAPGTPPGRPPGTAPGTPPGRPPGTDPKTPPGRPSGRPPGTAPGTPPGASPGVLPGALLGAAPGLLLATGQMLPVSSVHRLARTSTLVRLVMDADGQVLDMGRKVRLATPAQRRAVFARYATCWIDGCPLPATMCQIDHADNWSTGGLTDLKLLGPACQFHNRDRYRHPDRYTRRKLGTDRWAFTYHPLARARRLRE